MMQLWAFLVLLLPLINGDVSHLLPKDYIPPSAAEQTDEAKEIQRDPSGFYPSNGLPLPPGYAIPTGSNVPPPPVQPPNFPLPIYPPFFGFGGGAPGEGVGPGIGAGGGGPFPGGPPNAAFQLPAGGAFPGGSFGPQTGFPPQAAGFPPQAAGFPPQAAGFPPQGAGFPPQEAGFPTQGAGFPPQGAGFAPQGAGFSPQGAGFPPQGAGFPPQGAGFPTQGPGFPPQGAGFQPGNGFPPQGPPFAPQGVSGNGFPGGPFPPEFLTNQGLPLTNPQGPPFQGFNVPPGFGGPSVPVNQNPYQQFGPGFGGPAPPGYSDEEHPEKVEEPRKEVPHPHPLADDPKSVADTVYAPNGGYVYKRAK
ncbi:hypothetical protein KR084_001073 [Drosophila pseudotakahashii]|nr:hypothetical protein KR084_001073 [Drosophila pseudotakahashii]